LLVLNLVELLSSLSIIVSSEKFLKCISMEL
jgi:hypothetical protein